MEKRIVTLALASLELSCQVRAENPEAVKRYVEWMLDESDPPAIVVYRDEEGLYHVADGNHRVLAAREAGRVTIDAEVREGERYDAWLCALGSNHDHGASLTIDDLKSMALSMMQDPNHDWNGREISEHLRNSVVPQTVNRWRRDWEKDGTLELSSGCSKVKAAAIACFADVEMTSWSGLAIAEHIGGNVTRQTVNRWRKEWEEEQASKPNAAQRFLDEVSSWPPIEECDKPEAPIQGEAPQQVTLDEAPPPADEPEDDDDSFEDYSHFDDVPLDWKPLPPEERAKLSGPPGDAEWTKDLLYVLKRGSRWNVPEDERIRVVYHQELDKSAYTFLVVRGPLDISLERRTREAMREALPTWTRAAEQGRCLLETLAACTDSGAVGAALESVGDDESILGPTEKGLENIRLFMGREAMGASLLRMYREKFLHQQVQAKADVPAYGGVDAAEERARALGGEFWGRVINALGLAMREPQYVVAQLYLDADHPAIVTQRVLGADVDGAVRELAASDGAAQRGPILVLHPDRVGEFTRFLLDTLHRGGRKDVEPEADEPEADEPEAVDADGDNNDVDTDGDEPADQLEHVDEQPVSAQDDDGEDGTPTATASDGPRPEVIAQLMGYLTAGEGSKVWEAVDSGAATTEEQTEAYRRHTAARRADSVVVEVKAASATDRDPLDRDYTPLGLALAAVREMRAYGLIPWTAQSRILEPSVGAGTWVKALRMEGFPGHLIGIDADPDLKVDADDLNEFYRADFLDLRPEDLGGFDVVLGNPPYSRPEVDTDGKPTGRRGTSGKLVTEECAALHVEHAARFLRRIGDKPRGTVAFLLRLGWTVAEARWTSPSGEPAVLSKLGMPHLWAANPRPSFRGGPTDGRDYAVHAWKFSPLEKPTNVGDFRVLRWDRNEGEE